MSSLWYLCITTLVLIGIETNAMVELHTDLHTDLTNFVSEPDIKAPLFNITHHDEGTISPGYWFLDVYDGAYNGFVSSAAQLYQMGPHIFDNRGELIWSGASVFNNWRSFNFKTVQINGTTHLSFILYPNEEDELGAGITMDTHYQIQHALHMSDDQGFDMHEFNIIEDGHSALVVTWSATEMGFHDGIHDATMIGNHGFQEVDLITHEILFDWKSLDHVNTSTSKEPIKTSKKENGTNGTFYDFYGGNWDWFHINSIDKNIHGDYLISSRHTSSIYKISGHDGSVIWTLGGDSTSFVHEAGFNFSWQHDARFLEDNSTHTIISLFDNASNGLDIYVTANVSSALYVALRTDTSPMTATVITKFDRPDGNITTRRGNTQKLEDDHIFVCWSDNGYISEYTPSGELALEAKFVSDRLVVNRGYKYNFIGLPVNPPALKAYSFGTTAETITTVFYVSWNGATEVAEWRFYGNGFKESKFYLLGRAKKESFETMFMSAGYQTLVYAEALNADGDSLGRSEVFETILPTGWKFGGCSEAPTCQIPDVVTPLIGSISDGEEYTKQADQDVSMAKEDGLLSFRNTVVFLILLVCGGLGVFLSLLFVLRQRLRSWKSAEVTKIYELVQSEDIEEDSVGEVLQVQG